MLSVQPEVAAKLLRPLYCFLSPDQTAARLEDVPRYSIEIGRNFNTGPRPNEPLEQNQ